MLRKCLGITKLYNMWIWCELPSILCRLHSSFFFEQVDCKRSPLKPQARNLKFDYVCNKNILSRVLKADSETVLPEKNASIIVSILHCMYIWIDERYAHFWLNRSGQSAGLEVASICLFFFLLNFDLIFHPPPSNWLRMLACQLKFDMYF